MDAAALATSEVTAKSHTTRDACWCGAFAIDVPTELVITLPFPSAGDNGTRRLVQVTVEAVGPSLLICLDTALSAPYRIVNDFPNVSVTVRQRGTDHAQVIAPRTSLDYTWGEPTGSRILLVALKLSAEQRATSEADGVAERADQEAALRHLMDTQHGDVADAAPGGEQVGPEIEICPGELRDPIAHSSALGSAVAFWTTVRLGHSTRVVQISPSCPQDEAGSAQLESSMLVAVTSVSLSLVDTVRTAELAYLRADDVSLSAMSSELEHEAQITIGRIQIDQMLPRAICPVLLIGATLEASGSNAWLRCHVIRRRREKRLKHVTLDAQQLMISLDEAFIIAMHTFGKRSSPNPSLHVAPLAIRTATRDASASASIPASNPLDGIDGTSYATSAELPLLPEPLKLVHAHAAGELKASGKRLKRPWYIDTLSLHAISLTLSYRKLPEGPTRRGGRGAAMDGAWRPPALPNIDNLMLNLRSFELAHRFFERRKLLKAFRRHYRSEMRRHVHKILLHTDVTGLVAGSAVARAGRGMLSSFVGRRRTAGTSNTGGGAKASLAGDATGLGSSGDGDGSGRMRPPRTLIGDAASQALAPCLPPAPFPAPASRPDLSGDATI